VSFAPPNFGLWREMLPTTLDTQLQRLCTHAGIKTAIFGWPDNFGIFVAGADTSYSTGHSAGGYLSPRNGWRKDRP